MARRRRKTAARWLTWIFRSVAAVVLLVGLLALWTWIRLPSDEQLQALANSDPGPSALMRQRQEEADEQGRSLPLKRVPVPLNRIAKALQRGVVLGEDQKFWHHDGIDWIETRNAMEEAIEKGQLRRGGSTITQQLAKNLYLSQDRSLLRKGWEWLLADRMEQLLTKRRILELYLNYAEWGPGIFGAEAAAQAHFHKSAFELTPAEAAILTAMLPAPLKRDPRHPTPNLRRRARIITQLLARAGLGENISLQQQVDALLSGQPAADNDD